MPFCVFYSFFGGTNREVRSLWPVPVPSFSIKVEVFIKVGENPRGHPRRGLNCLKFSELPAARSLSILSKIDAMEPIVELCSCAEQRWLDK
jgi:hypothetical protein